jgi:hypothetical protein
MIWFSVCLRRASIIERVGIVSLWDSTYLLRAIDRSDAWKQGLKIGNHLESKYANMEGQEVSFSFLGVLTIDELGEDLESGQEVFFKVHDFPQPIPISQNATFLPETVVPGNSGVGIEEI